MIQLVYGKEVIDAIIGQEKSILEIFRGNFQCSFSSCGERGTCGRCRIQVLKGDVPITKSDQKIFTKKELEEGYRLACKAYPKDNCTILAHFVETPDIHILMETSNEDRIGEETYVTDASENRKVFAGNGHQDPMGIIIDIGTTTVAMQLIDRDSGTVCGSHGFLNPQRAFGTDVISRIEAANRGYLYNQRNSIGNELMAGIEILDPEKAARKIVIAGNTTMIHLLLGLSCETLGKYPFSPIVIEEEHFSFRKVFGEERENTDIVIMPGISTFVGADILSGIYAVEMDKKENPVLFIDLGTNGEMAIGNRENIFTTATAAGPAFEGDITANLPGTDMIAIIGAMLEKGIIDSTGLFQEPYFSDGYQISSVILKQSHIRQMQMAKAAVRAGIEILTKEYGITYDQIETVFLAGGFGYKLDVDKAFRIGLLPEELEGKVTAALNTSLGGCKKYLMDVDASENLIRIRNMCKSINLAEKEGFDEIYLDSMNFK